VGGEEKVENEASSSYRSALSALARGKKKFAGAVQGFVCQRIHSLNEKSLEMAKKRKKEKRRGESERASNWCGNGSERGPRVQGDEKMIKNCKFPPVSGG